ncbi:MAG: DUF2769 domain-containing protein [Methanosarcina sp.]
MDPKIKVENKNNQQKADTGKPAETLSAEIQKTREEYGRYFGICGSYHHLKGCLCKNCSSYQGGSGMFCSRKKRSSHEKAHACLCNECEVFRKFGLEGENFCQ